MNCPSHCVIFGHRNAQLPRAPVARGRLRPPAPLRARRRRPRPRPRPQLLPGRRAHLLHARAAHERDQRRSCSCSTASTRRSSSPRSTSSSRRAPRSASAPTSSGTRAEKALADALDASRPPVRDLPGRGRVLRPQARVPRAGRAQAQLAARHDPVRLRTCPSASSSSTPAPTARSTGRSCSTAPILGSLERFFAIYLEHCGGAFPAWLAPEQAVIITVGEEQNEYAQRGRRAPEIEGPARPRRPQPREARLEEARRAQPARAVHPRRRRSRSAGAARSRPWSRDTKADLGPMPLEQFTELLVAEAMVPRILPKDA